MTERHSSAPVTHQRAPPSTKSEPANDARSIVAKIIGHWQGYWLTRAVGGGTNSPAVVAARTIWLSVLTYAFAIAVWECTDPKSLPYPSASAV